MGNITGAEAGEVELGILVTTKWSRNDFINSSLSESRLAVSWFDSIIVIRIESMRQFDASENKRNVQLAPHYKLYNSPPI